MMFEFDGIDELIDEFEQLQHASEEVGKAALLHGARTLQKEFQNNIYKRIDFDSGVAQESITISKISKKGEIHVGPTTDAFYLNFLENGFYNVMVKKYVSATPIFQPLFLQSRLKVINAMVQAARNELIE